MTKLPIIFTLISVICLSTLIDNSKCLFKDSKTISLSFQFPFPFPTSSPPPPPTSSPPPPPPPPIPPPPPPPPPPTPPPPTPSPSPPSLRVYQFRSTEGPNATLYAVARSAISTTDISFGTIYVGDNPILAGSDPNSHQLGRIQGTITTTGLYQPAVVLNLNFIFTAGIYKGSKLIVAGQRVAFSQNQEIPIIGGTGALRGVRGYAISNYISFNPTVNAYLYSFDLYVDGAKILG